MQSRQVRVLPGARAACRLVPAGIGLILALSAAPARAVIVPDEAPTIQAAIDGGAADILVRPGVYPERPRIGRPLSIAGLIGSDPADLPVVSGLVFENITGNETYSVYLRVSNLHFTGSVEGEFVHDDLGWLLLYPILADCVVDSNVIDSNSLYRASVQWGLVACTIGGNVDLRHSSFAFMDRCVVRGAVTFVDQDIAGVQACRVEGHGPCGVSGSTREDFRVRESTIRGYDVGVLPGGYDGNDLRNNLIEGCGVAIRAQGLEFVDVIGNTLRSNTTGLALGACEWGRIEGNRIEDCGTAVSGWCWDVQLARNRVEDCPGGVGLQGEGLRSHDNRIERSGGMGLSADDIECSSERDTVIECTGGISLSNPKSTCRIAGARVLSCGGPGIRIDGWNPSATGCVVGRCGGDGILAQGYVGVVLAGNTAYLNQGSGFAAGNDESQSTVGSNLAFGNQRYGLSIGPSAPFSLSCNDWFGNAAGTTVGIAPDPTDLAVDPQFCDVQRDDVHLTAGSPLLDAPGCGLIGALGSGCTDGPTATLVSRFEAERVAAGVRDRWELNAATDELSLERAEALDGPWVSILADRVVPSGLGSHLDADATERPRWYRLLARDGGALRVIAGPIEVAAAPRRFALIRVSPNPATGPVALEFTLAQEAPIEISVIDVQGRVVARPARGTWPAGRHLVAWDGEGTIGRLPPGLYRVRYRFPGGQDLRALALQR